jgi:uncharacterized membrane protein YhaH (DUF805 family)
MAEMGMMQAVRSVFSNYVGFSGRARRSEYWWFTLFNIIIGIGLAIVDISMFGTCTTGEMSFNCSSGNTLGLIWTLVTLLPGLAVWIRRLHDINRSGWWTLLAIVPLVGWIILLVWACKAGDTGPNDYGPDPKAA